ncbi:MAG TPA: hypothetical protein VN903_11410 [Polyangia bacterium]|nr:hypothetical protein [Polyangia bacterium]
MPYAFVLYPTPLDAHVTLKPDSGGAVAGIPYSDASGRPGQLCTVADGVPTGQGAELNLEAPGYVSLRLRGFLQLKDGVGRLQVDDYTLPAEPAAPAPGPTPPPATGGSPLEIINRVYAATNPNLATAAGCGKFTEDCCDALHVEHSPMWGHIAKTEGQNQFNGHAVDALMLLANVSTASGGTTAGIYDIIFSSASFEAKPVFNYVEPPNYELWYYPADAATRGVTMAALPRFDRR